MQKGCESHLQATYMRGVCGVHAGRVRDALVLRSCFARIQLVFSSCSAGARFAVPRHRHGASAGI